MHLRPVFLYGTLHGTFVLLFKTGMLYICCLGASDFLRRALKVLLGCQRVIVTIEFTRCSASRPMIQWAMKAGRDHLAAYDLFPLVVADSAAGGSTDSQHLLGFGHDLGTLATPVVEPSLLHTLHHVLDGGTKGHFPSVLRSSLPVLVNPARAVLLHEGVARPKGLLPNQFLDILVYAPSYILRDCWEIHGLTLLERLWLHQLPLHMEPLLAGLSPCGHLPFEDSPSPEVYTSVSCVNLGRLLWGGYVGRKGRRQ
jgi:hypothetical protein